MRITAALILFSASAFISPVSAQSIDTKWTVTKYAGEASLSASYLN